MSNPDIDDSSENVLSDWPSYGPPPEEDPEEDASAEPLDDAAEIEEVNEVDEVDEVEDAAPAWGTSADVEPEAEAVPQLEPEVVPDREPEPEPEPGAEEAAAEPAPYEEDAAAFAVPSSLEHAAGDLDIPEDYAVLEGVADGGRRAVGVVVARFNGTVTTRLLARALEELEQAGVRREAITIMVVPGAFELPVAATALAKTRRFACIVALGCVIRGDTPHFDYVASEAASGLQLAALETGVPVSFGVLTLDRVEQAEPRIEKAGEAVRSALEMADVFSHLRAAAAR
jgi:6,7-dimethyl-8-ribityllumazine synthase